MNEEIAKTFIGEYGYFLAGAFIAFLFKKFIQNAVESILVFLGSDLNADDTVLVGTDEREARIVRMGMRKTIFYMKSLKGDEVKMPVPNERLKSMIIKKKLPMNGGNSEK